MMSKIIKSATVTPLKGQLISVQELGAFLGTSPHAVRDWIEEGLPIHERGGAGTAHKINSAAAAIWWAQHKAGVGRGRPPREIDDTPRPKDRETAAKADLAELKLKEARSEVISQAGLDGLLADIATQIRIQFVNFIRENYGDRAVKQAQDFLNDIADKLSHPQPEE